MSDLRKWAKRRAMRPGTGLVPVEVDVHTERGVIRAIRYHRPDDAKKLIAEGKAHAPADTTKEFGRFYDAMRMEQLEKRAQQLEKNRDTSR